MSLIGHFDGYSDECIMVCSSHIYSFASYAERDDI